MQIVPQIKNIVPFAAVGSLQRLETKLGLEDTAQNLSMKGSTPKSVNSLLRAPV